MAVLRKTRALWLALFSAALVLAFAIPAVARSKSKPAPRPDRRFEHAAHAAAFKAKTGKDQKCGEQCHKVDSEGKFLDTGRKAHARCDGCHTFFRRCSSSARKQGKVCVVCHQNFKCLDGPKPDVTVMKTTYVATYSHKKHIATGSRTGRQCEGCHGKFGDAPPRKQGALAGGHDFCSGCHERGIEPLMPECGSCHKDRNSPAGKTPVVTARPTNQYAVSGAFDHKRHAKEKRVGTKGRDCLVCHSNIKTAKSDADIPLPTMKGCEKSCHNGDKAFDAVGTGCTRCHTGGRK